MSKVCLVFAGQLQGSFNLGDAHNYENCSKGAESFDGSTVAFWVSVQLFIWGISKHALSFVMVGNGLLLLMPALLSCRRIL